MASTSIKLPITSGGGGGSSTFTGLTDTPSSFSGNSLQVVRVNVGESALEFSAAGSGDVAGAASSTDNALVRFHTTTGKILQNSSVIVDDTNNMSGIGNITLSGTVDGIDIATDVAANTSKVSYTDAATVSANTSKLATIAEGEGSTGVITGGIISIGTPNTTFSLSDGNGTIFDHTTSPASPTLTAVSWSGKTNITITNIATHIITFISIDSGGNVIQRTSSLTNAQRRDEIYLGVAVHVDKTIMNTQNNEQATSFNPAAQVHDLAKAIGFFNVSGNIIGASGADLTIDKSVGDIFYIGSNYNNDKKNPNQLTLATLTNISFQYRFQDGSNGTTGTTVDPDIWDNGGTSTAVSNNKWTVQRVYSFISNAVKIQPGQTEYSSLAEAKEGITLNNFITEPSITANGLLRGFLIVKEGVTDLSTSDAQFIEAEKFGTATGSGGLSVSSLQDGYDNSIDPEVVLTSSGNGIQIRDAATPIAVDLFAIENNAGSTQYLKVDTAGIDVTGNIAVSGTVDGIDIATDVAANTSKATNATHTSEVTGSGALTVDKTAISNKSLVSAAVGDHVLIGDADDTDNLKKVTVQTIVDLAGGGSGDVVGGGTVVDNTIARYDTTTGLLLQPSGVAISDTNTMSGIENITLSGTVDGIDIATDVAANTSKISYTDAAAVSANTSKVTNATHTGEVTGGTALTVDKTAISNKSLVSAAVGDHILIGDLGDSDNLKKVTVQTIIDLAGGGAIDSLADGDTSSSSTSLFLGTDVGNGSSAVGNTGVGIECLPALSSGQANTAYGHQSGKTLSTQANNTHIGTYSGEFSTAPNCTFVGASAGYNTGNGTNNTAVGYLAYNRSGNSCLRNTAMGATALRGGATNQVFSFNVAVGESALKGILTGGSNNTGIGTDAAILLSTGTDNTILGYTSAGTLTTGSNNTVIGANVDVAAAGTSGNVIIGKGDGTIRAHHNDTAWNFKTGYGTPISGLTSGTNVSVDLALSNTFTMTVGHNFTLDNPSNAASGQEVTFVFTQGAGSQTITLGSEYLVAAGSLTLSTGAGDIDTITFKCYDGTNLVEISRSLNNS